ncbi:MAG: DUF2752 domain-containing protein [Phycisphaeraceae bacterium]|nr:DUF2752 domain-containing protein [Phycisphaeraceae bacterium]
MLGQATHPPLVPPTGITAGLTGRRRSVAARARATIGERIAAAAVAAMILAVLVTAASLRPSPTGVGTHRQLGMSVCGWIATIDRPCPTCGMTTAFSCAANRRPLDSLRAQPFAAVAAVVAAAAFWGAAHVAVFGSCLGLLAGRLVLRPRVLWPVGVAWAASWVYKVVSYAGGAG